MWTRLTNNDDETAENWQTRPVVRQGTPWRIIPQGSDSTYRDEHHKGLDAKMDWLTDHQLQSHLELSTTYSTVITPDKSAPELQQTAYQNLPRMVTFSRWILRTSTREMQRRAHRSAICKWLSKFRSCMILSQNYADSKLSYTENIRDLHLAVVRHMNCKRFMY